MERTVWVDGQSVEVAYEPDGRYSAGRLVMNLRRGAPVSLRVERRNEFDRLLERTPWVKPIVSSDSNFDSTFKIISDHPGFAAACFQRPERREAARVLFDLGCHHLEIDREGTRAVWKAFTFDRKMDDKFIKEGLPAMLPLSAYWPGGPVAAPGWLTEERFKTALVLAAAAWVVLAVALTLAHDGDPSLDPERVLRATLKVSLPLLVLAVLPLAAAIRGRSWSARGLGLFSAGALVVFTLSGYGIGAWLNCRWDTGPARSRRVEVLDKEERKYKRGGREYRLSLRSWRPGEERELMVVSRDFYREVEQGPGQVTVVTRPGWLGCEWLVELRP